jgi:hypothetical protein
VAQAQACALEDGDLARFARLQDERDDALRRVEHLVTAPAVAAVREILQAAVEVDRRTASRLHALRAETERALRQVRQGHSAVAGYGRIGAYLSSTPAQVDRLR